MFIRELIKYSQESSVPIVLMFEDLGVEAFTMLARSATFSELEEIIEAIPKEKNEILSIINDAYYDALLEKPAV